MTMNEPKNETVPFKVSKSKKKEILQFCKKRDFNLGAFVRVAVEESMASIVARENEKKDK